MTAPSVPHVAAHRPAGDGDRCVLAIDLGTGGPKVAVVDGTGRVLAWRSRSVATQLIGARGAEQDPRDMWSATVGATREVLGALRPAPPIIAVAVTSQYMSAVPVTSDGMPVGPCILWMDTRGGDHNLTLLDDRTFGLFIERHGLIPLPSGNDNVAHSWVLREHHPSVYAAADHIVEPMDYITGRLTGRVTSTQSTAFSFLACDNRTWGSTEHDPSLVAASGLDEHTLAPLVAMRGAIGGVRRSVADELGIPAGTPVVPGTIDSITSAIGTGALSSDRAAIVIGTTAVMVSHVEAHRGDLTSGILSVPSPVQGRYFVLAENGVGGRALEWAVSLFGWGDPEAAVDAASRVPAGADGVGFLPWLIGSMSPSPNDDVRAAFVGLGLGHGREHLTRAVLEGVALNLAWLRPAFEEFLGATPARMHFGGGGATGTEWADILADALDLPVDRLSSPRATNARGAALLALADVEGLDLDDVPSMLEVASRHEPRDAHRPAMRAALDRHIALHPPLALVATHH